MELTEVIYRRRTIRKFTEHYVTDNQLKELLEAARAAQSWANTQVWEFIVVRERELIQQVTETYSAANPARKCSSEASAIILVCAKVKVSGCWQGEEVTKFKEWFLFDLGVAVQNICLRAHDLGLGTVVVGSLDHDACRELVSLPDEYEIVAALPIGEPKFPDKTGPARKELKECVHLDQFGDNFGNIY